MKAGVKNIGTVFLMTDAQVSDEKFLVLINDLLASGEIPDLFPDDEVENIIGGKWYQWPDIAIETNFHCQCRNEQVRTLLHRTIQANWNRCNSWSQCQPV